MRILLLLASHALVGGAGVALGIYLLPILVAPPAPGQQALQAVASAAQWTGTIPDDLAGSDLLHWGKGTFSISPDAIAHTGTLAPGPDYRLYLSPSFVQDEDGFLTVKAGSLEVGPVRTFDGFVLPLPAGMDAGAYTTAVVWCETFGEFITAAKYR